MESKIYQINENRKLKNSESQKSVIMTSFARPKYSILSITIQLNLQNKQEIQISAKHTLQNAAAMATSNPKTKFCHITKLPDKFEEKSYDIWKGYLKLSENASFSNLAQASKATPPPPPKTE